MQEKKKTDGTQFTKQSSAMTVILKYHLQDGNVLIHRGKSKTVEQCHSTFRPMVRSSATVNNCEIRQWKRDSHLLCVTSQRVLATFCISHHSPTHRTAVSNLMLISALRQHHMGVHMVFQYSSFLYFKHLPLLSTCGDTKPQGNYTIKYLEVSVMQKKV